MTITQAQDELAINLLDQAFSSGEQQTVLLNEYKQSVRAYVNVDRSVAVLSDFQANCSYIYAGAFGKFFGLPSEDIVIDSAFEECIFNKFHPEDLLERHVLELRYFQFLKNQPQEERLKYSIVSRVRARNTLDKYLFITHRTLYLKCLPDGSVWLALCLYAPSLDQSPRLGVDNNIINNETGEILPVEKYEGYDRGILSRRELEILTLVAQGMPSKQIACQLNIALYTVHRHRQNIIEKLQVANTAEAVKTALVMGLITL
ncbi:LuxR C-terminal-related transcriptional regulator [uncultured Bacteroides sp.]|uniref:response regulator transcription factor n=1 Tax=uncultured Bacteroides sp. TaxID=162156 RepID=UPI002AAB8D30|nr:LuxR C-terminal-related transcriptional regulator [uncultured Bacteroides sp.]